MNSKKKLKLKLWKSKNLYNKEIKTKTTTPTMTVDAARLIMMEWKNEKEKRSIKSRRKTHFIHTQLEQQLA